MEDLTAGVIGMAVILLVVVIHLLIQWVDKFYLKEEIKLLEKDIEELEERIDNNWNQEISHFNSLNKRIKKLEKEREQPTVSNECFSNEYYERANRQALDIAKYTEFLARENSKEMIDRLEAIPYQFRTDTEREVLRSIQLTDPRNNINNK